MSPEIEEKSYPLPLSGFSSEVTRYAYIQGHPKKRKNPVHELDENGRTYCQAENSTNRLTFTVSLPAGRRECRVCKGVKEEREYQATHGKLDEEFRNIVR